MKHAWSGAVAVFACALTMSLSAQSAPPAGGQQPTPQAPSTSPGMQRSADAQNTVTLTGCLERASASAAAPTGTTGAAAGASSAAAKFVLNNVTPSSSAGAAGTAGTAGSATASSYSLDGDDSKLSPHVGHKVEITGTTDNRSATGAERAGQASANAPKLKVTAVKMIASSCTPQ